MQVYIVQHLVKPTKKNPHYQTIKVGYAVTWAKASNEDDAEVRAERQLVSEEWKIVALERNAFASTFEDCPSEEAKLHFLKALSVGVSVAIGGCGIGGETSLN